jgi:thioredoxin-like negative regulator of GroEL
MTGLAFCVLLQAAVVGGEAQSYNDALRSAQGNDQPLVILVGADWCPGCRIMKQATLPSLQRRGALEKVQFSVVDTDADPALAQRLMQGQSIPQLVVYTRTEQGWQKTNLVGARSEAEIQATINQAVALQSRASKVASKPN